jgi:hypothetical protein
MAMWKDQLLRLNLADNGTYPNRPGSPCESPDIIPCGVAPIPDWQTFFAGNYASDVGKNPYGAGGKFRDIEAADAQRA